MKSCRQRDEEGGRDRDEEREREIGMKRDR